MLKGHLALCQTSITELFCENFATKCSIGIYQGPNTLNCLFLFRGVILISTRNLSVGLVLQSSQICKICQFLNFAKFFRISIYINLLTTASGKAPDFTTNGPSQQLLLIIFLMLIIKRGSYSMFLRFTLGRFQERI